VVLKSVGLYYLKADRLDQLVPSGPSLFPQKYCFAVRTENDELLSRLNEGLFIVKGSGTYARLYEQYFGSLEPPATPFTTFLWRSLALLVPVLAILLAVLAWTWSLRRLVRQRTRSLQDELAERQRVSEALQATEARFTRLFRSMTDAYVQVDMDGRILDCNPTYQRMLGYTREELRERTFYDLTPPAWHAAQREIIASQVLPLGWSRPFEKEYQRKDGSRFPVEVLMYLLLDDQGQTSGMWGIIRDITERKRADEAIKESERKLAHLVANVPGYLFQCANAPGWPVSYMSEGCRNLTGYPPEAFLHDRQIRFSDLILPEHRESARARWIAAIQASEVFEAEYPIRHADGSVRWLWERASGIHDDQGRLLLVEGFVTDVTGRRQAEQALTELQEAWTQFIRHSPVYLYIKDVTPEASRVVLASDNFVDMIGIPGSEMAGRTMEELYPPNLAAVMTADDQRVVERGVVLKVDEELNGRSYTSIKFPIRIGDRTWLGGYTIDITDRLQMEAERRQLEAQLQHAQKMESMGSLAGGVAHDMNNVLGAILSLASVELERAPEGSALRQNLDTITRACVRGGTLVKGLLGFARQRLMEERPLDLNALVKEEVALLERTTLQKVRLSADLAPDLAPVQGDPAALSHALMNLCVNAVDAMPQGGSLHLRTRNDGPAAILLEVVDTGAGMPPEVLQKAMDPFYTTKPQGQGTGLGLSIVYATVKAHRGEIRLRSTPGRGTTVTIRLPARQERPAAEAADGPAQPAARSLRVLVVDDDDLIRESTSQILAVLGHRATVASGGEEALRMLAEGLEVDRVILDLNMPGLGGAETLPRLRALRPDLPVLVATGRPDQQAQALVETYPRVSLLAKPFMIKDLAEHLAG
jgi:PAS domain S-box-containing protein